MNKRYRGLKRQLPSTSFESRAARGPYNCLFYIENLVNFYISANLLPLYSDINSNKTLNNIEIEGITTVNFAINLFKIFENLVNRSLK